MSMTIILIGVGVVAVSAVLLAMMFVKSNQVSLTGKTDGKPEWMHDMPPAETVAATLKEGEGVTLYDHDEGEHLAAPFAEQIEDVLRAKLEGDPVLKSFDVDFGTAPDGTLEIWVNGAKFESLDKLPDEHLKQTFRQAVKEWNKKK